MSSTFEIIKEPGLDARSKSYQNTIEDDDDNLSIVESYVDIAKESPASSEEQEVFIARDSTLMLTVHFTKEIEVIR